MLTSLWTRKKKDLKRSISSIEITASVIINIILAAIIIWILAQRNDYSPDERDISPELLKSTGKKIQLHKTTLRSINEKPLEKLASGNMLGIFPVSILNGGWKASSRVRSFSPKNLYVKINGEAYKFLKQGFRALHYIRITDIKGSEEISIELFDQGDQRGSLGVFSEYVSQKRKPVKRRRSVYIPTSAGAIGRMGPYFFRISGNKETGSIRQKSEQIALALSSLSFRKKAAAAGFRILKEKMKIESSRIVYQAKNVFQFDFARDFWFGRVDSKKAGRIFIHRVKDPGNTSNLFKRLVEGQAMDYRILKRSGNSAIMQHSFLKTFFMIKFKGIYIYGIENVEVQAELNPLIQRMDTEIANER